MNDRNNPKDTLFGGMPDDMVIKKYYVKAKTENVIKDVMTRKHKDIEIKPTKYRKVK